MTMASTLHLWSHRGAAATPPTNHPKEGENSAGETAETKERSILRSPPGILALGAVLDHIVTCDCSYKHVTRVWNDEENDTLRLAYGHHAATHKRRLLKKTSSTAALAAF